MCKVCGNEYVWYIPEGWMVKSKNPDRWFHLLKFPLFFAWTLFSTFLNDWCWNEPSRSQSQWCLLNLGVVRMNTLEKVVVVKPCVGYSIVGNSAFVRVIHLNSTNSKSSERDQSKWFMHQSVCKSTFFGKVHLSAAQFGWMCFITLSYFFKRTTGTKHHQISVSCNHTCVKWCEVHMTKKNILAWRQWRIDAAKGTSLLSAWCPKQLLRDCAWCAQLARIVFETSADLPDETIFGQRFMNLAGQVFRGYVLAFRSQAINVD